MHGGKITKQEALVKVIEPGKNPNHSVDIVHGIVRIREGGEYHLTGHGIEKLFTRDSEVVISISDLKKNADDFVFSENALQEKLQRKNYDRSNLFANWEVNIRKLYTPFDVIMEMIYHCLGYYEYIENLQAYYYGEYLIKKLVKLLSCENLSSESQRKLTASIKESALFKRKVSNASNITEGDVYVILRQVKSMLYKKDVSDQAKISERQIEPIAKVNKKETAGKLDEKTRILKSAEESCKIEKYDEAIEQYNRIVRLCWWESSTSRKEEIMFRALEGLEAIYKFAYENGKRDLYQKFAQPESGTDLITICKAKGLYYLTINYCEKILSASEKHILYYHLDKDLYKRAMIELMCILMDCYKCINDHYSEIECYKRFLNIPDLSSEDKYHSLKTLADVYIKKGRIGDAIETYEHILQLANNNIRKFYILDALSELYGKTNTAEAIEHFYRVIKTPKIDAERKCVAYQALAKLYHNLGQINNKIKHYELIVACPGVSHKQYIEALQHLAYLHEHDIEKALGYFRQMVKTSAINGRTKNKLRLLALTTWVDFYCRKPQVKISETDLLMILQKLEGLYNYPKKIKCCKNILKLNYLPSNGLHKLTLLFKQMNQVSEEIESYERILKIKEITPNCRLKALERLTILYSNINNLDKAKQCYAESINCGVNQREHYVLLFHLSEAYERLADINNAIECCKYILNTFKDIAESEYYALNKLANIYNRINNPEMAIECYDRIIKSESIDEMHKISTIRELAELFRTKDLDKAIEYYERILNFPKTLPVHRLDAIEKLSVIYNQVGDSGKIVSIFEAIVNSPEKVLKVKHAALQELIKIQCKVNDINKEIAYCEMDLILIEKLKLNPISLLERLIKLYDRVGNNESKQINIYEAILQLPGNDLKHLSITKKVFSLYSDINDDLKQIECYERLIKLKNLKLIIKISGLKALLGLYQQVDNKSKIQETKRQLTQLELIQSIEDEEVKF